MIYYLPDSLLLSLCTCRLYFTETQVANRGSGTSNQISTGEILPKPRRRGSSFLRTLLIPCQFRPNHWRHSRMISYHCFSVETENQKRCSSWVVILSGSIDFDIVESLEISVSIQLPLPALHRAVPPLAYSQGQRHPIVRVLLILICVVSTAHRPGGATSYGGLIRNLQATGDYSGVSPIHSLLSYPFTACIF